MAGYLSSLSFLDLAGRLPASVAQGLFWAIVALGVYITFRILDIAGIWPVDTGSIVIDGQDVTDLPDFKRASLIG